VRAAQLVLYKNPSRESTKRALQFPRASLLEQLIFCFRVCEEPQQQQQQEAGKKIFCVFFPFSLGAED
jgi:hypothetical protein